MIVNGANLNAIFLNLSKVFNQTFNEVEVEYPAIAMVVPSNGAYVDYRWLANFPQMKEWIGKNTLPSLQNMTMSFVTKTTQQRLKCVVTILKMTKWESTSRKLNLLLGLQSSIQMNWF